MIRQKIIDLLNYAVTLEEDLFINSLNTQINIGNITLIPQTSGIVPSGLPGSGGLEELNLNPSLEISLSGIVSVDLASLFNDTGEPPIIIDVDTSVTPYRIRRFI